MRCAEVRFSRLAVLVLVGVLGTGAGRGEGLRYHAGGWLLGPGTMAAAASPDSIREGSWVRWSMGQGQLFGMPELPLLGCDVTVGRTSLPAGTREPTRWQVRARWQRLGGGSFCEDRWELAFLRAGRWRVGVCLGGERLLLAGETGPAHGDLTAQLGRRWAWPGGIEGWCDVHLPLDDDPAGDTRRVRPAARLALRHAGVVGIVAWDRRGGSTPLLGGEIVVALSPTVALQWRLDGASGSFGPGLAIRRGGLIVRTSHVVHPDLGATHRWQLIVGAGGAAFGSGP